LRPGSEGAFDDSDELAAWPAFFGDPQSFRHRVRAIAPKQPTASRAITHDTMRMVTAAVYEVRLRRVLWPGLLVGGYVAVWFLAGFLPIVPTDLDISFWPSAKEALAGHPLLVYAPAGQLAYPNANGPLSLVPLTAVGALLRAIGWLDTILLRRAVTFAIFSLFILGMAREGVAAIERLRGGRLDARPRLLAYGVLALGGPLWQSLVGYGHIEQAMEVWLGLLAVRWLNRGWAVRAGIAFGLMVLARSTAALLCLPLVLSAWRQGASRTAGFLSATAATGLAGLMPFLIADPADVVHSLFTYRGSLQVGAGSIWSITRGDPLEAVGQHYDIVFVVTLALVLNLWLASRPGGFTEQRLFAGLALTASCLALLAKTVWPYYLMEAYVFATVWAFGRWKADDGLVALLMAPIAISVLGLLAEFGSTPGLRPGPVAVEGVTMFVLLGAWMVWTVHVASREDATQISNSRL
jgi:hypothetical protein